MHFHKPATTIDEQITLLTERGMTCGDEELLRNWLRTVGYYRLSAYWLRYEEPAPKGQTRSKRFKPETRFEDVVRIYIFDRKLRLLTMEAIERIEIALRSRWTNRMTLAHGAHAHLDAKNFGSPKTYKDLVAGLQRNIGKSRETFIEHYRQRYETPILPPLWAVTETMTFGELSKWVAATKDNKVQSSVARDLGLPTSDTLEGALQLLALVRNICAHHGRLWNRRTVKRLPNIKRFGADIILETNGTQTQADNLIYNVLVLLTRMLRHQTPETSFATRLASLIDEMTDTERGLMGFPPDWTTRSPWV